MPSAILARVRELDTDSWRLATWLSPVAFQVGLATFYGIGWLLSQGLIDSYTALPALVVAAAGGTAAACLLAGAALLVTRSSRLHGFGLSIAGSGVAVLFGGLVYAPLLLTLLKPGA